MIWTELVRPLNQVLGYESNSMTEQSRQLAHSWQVNAEPWTKAVRSRAIASRRLATDDAILEAIRDRRPNRLLDMGCGEGWLVRSLANGGVEVMGVDASVPLIESARAEGGGHFAVYSYAEVTEKPERVESEYDVIVFNFALFEEEIAPLLSALRTRLSSRGVLLINTLHPWSEIGQGSYQDGWRTETFAAIEGFTEPMPWYFRTLASWLELLRKSHYRVEQLSEPAHPESHEPLSLLFTAAPLA
jgi:2-polyprenyl-3-methyl-5-hydroxy-6-metoxy-1,4-benzoquinol methylase